jgi:hypothetical protein
MILQTPAPPVSPLNHSSLGNRDDFFTGSNAGTHSLRRSDAEGIGNMRQQLAK